MKRAAVVLAYGVALAVYFAVGWVAGLIIVVAALFGTVRVFIATANELAPAVRCPAGHVVPTFGRVRCGACGFTSEGSIWRCSNCNARYGHTLCPCGLSIRNPSL